MKMIDHRSCAHNLSRREIKLKNCGLNAIEPMTSAISVQWSTN